jgi:hypothetical protein
MHDCFKCQPHECIQLDHLMQWHQSKVLQESAICSWDPQATRYIHQAMGVILTASNVYCATKRHSGVYWKPIVDTTPLKLGREK